MLGLLGRLDFQFWVRLLTISLVLGLG